MMELRVVKALLAELDRELTLTSDKTDWEGLARKAYTVGSALLDRYVAAQPRVETKLITGSLFKSEERHDPKNDMNCNSGIEGCTCGGCDCGC